MRTNVTAMPGSKKLSATIEGADGILIAAPVYNYDVAAATKNMIELTGSAWEDKIVGFLCAAGGHAQLYVGDGVRKQSHAGFSLRDYSPVCVCHIPCFRRRAHQRQENCRANQTVADELVRFTKALRS